MPYEDECADYQNENEGEDRHVPGRQSQPEPQILVPLPLIERLSLLAHSFYRRLYANSGDGFDR